MFELRAIQKLKADPTSARFVAAFERANTRAAAKAVETARRLVPVRTGKLRSTIHAEITARGFKLTADTPYAKFMEYGTKRHVIRAKAGKRLAFTVNGRKVFAKKVNHPGTKPYRYLSIALLAAFNEFKATFKPGLAKA